MKLVWWVRSPLEIIQRPMDSPTHLKAVLLGKSVAYYPEDDTCRYSGAKGYVTGLTFTENIDAYNKADELRVAKIAWIDTEIERLATERKRLVDSDIKETTYESMLLELVDREKNRLLNEAAK